MRPVHWISTVVLALAASVAPAQTRYLPNSPGTWKPWRFIAYPDNLRQLGARQADVKELESQLLRLNALLQKTDGFTNPVGFSVETVGSIEPEPDRPGAGAGELAHAARPLPAILNFGAYPVMEFGSGATARRDDTGETTQVLFFVNQLSHPLFSIETQVPEFDKLDGDVARLAAPQPDVLGFTRYNDTLVLKKSTEPIWAAVTFGETLELVAKSIDRRLVEERDAVARLQSAYDSAKDPKKREARLARYRKIAPLQKDTAYLEKMIKADAAIEKQADDRLLPQIAAARAVVTRSEQELAGARSMAAGLAAAEKTAPACYDGEKMALARFRRAPAVGCVPLVRPNWKFFNPALPRSAPQLLTIALATQCLRADQEFDHPGGCAANKRLIESIDKAAVLAWLQ
jgi:hypothetical protein